MAPHKLYVSCNQNTPKRPFPGWAMSQTSLLDLLFLYFVRGKTKQTKTQKDKHNNNNAVK